MPETKAGRDLLLLLFAVPAALGLATLGTHDGPLLPQSWSNEFYLVKGLTALVATILVLGHMNRTWPHVGTLGQRMRYLCLLAFVWLVASSSVAQSNESAPVAGRNVAGLFVCVLTIVAMVVSIRHDRRKYR